MLRRAAVLKRICDRWMAQNAHIFRRVRCLVFLDGEINIIFTSYPLKGFDIAVRHFDRRNSTPSPTSFFTEVLPCVFCAFCLRWFRYTRIAAFKTLASSLAVLITRAIVFCVTSSCISTYDLHFHVRMLR